MVRYYGTKYVKLRNGQPYLYIPKEWDITSSDKILLTIWPGGQVPNVDNMFRFLKKPTKVNGGGGVAISLGGLDKIYWDKKLVSFSVDIIEKDYFEHNHGDETLTINEDNTLDLEPTTQ